MKIRAAVLEEFGQPLVVQEVDLAEPKAGEVLVRIEACGVCHTDMYTASGADPTGYAPCVLGHEGAGVVEKIGESVTLVKPGDHVITLFAPECGECIQCKSGRTNRCIAIREQQGLGYLPDGTARLSRNGEPMRHFMGTSTFAEYTVMPEIALAKVNPEAPLDGCAPFACGLSTGIGAALYTAQVERGSTAVVFGCGLVGLGAVIGARLAGAERIIAIDLAEGRLADARHHGATETRLAQRAGAIGSLLVSFVSILIWVNALLVILPILGINITPIIASAGVVGIALAFGAQTLVRDYISGIFLILEDQYGVGDEIVIGTVTGTVEEVLLRTTRLRDAEGTLWHFRNGEILSVGNRSQK